MRQEKSSMTRFLKAAHALFSTGSRDSGKYAASADGGIICTAGCGYGAVSSDDRQDYGQLKG